MQAVISRGPDLDELVACGHPLAEARGLPRAEDRALREELITVLVRKELVECAREGLLTRQEAVDAVLDHMWTFICGGSGTPLSVEWQDDLGGSCAGPPYDAGRKRLPGFGTTECTDCGTYWIVFLQLAMARFG